MTMRKKGESNDSVGTFAHVVLSLFKVSADSPNFADYFTHHF